MKTELLSKQPRPLLFVMKMKFIYGVQVILSLGCVCLLAVPGFAQTFGSGSTGALGPFAPPTGTTTTVALPADGVLNYTTINIPSTATVKFTPNTANTPVTMPATGDVTIAGTIQLSGSNGGLNGNPTNFGGIGGPGGFPGGQGESVNGSLPASTGQGPGGGPAGTYSFNNASYGAPSSFTSLLPLVGGSGGGGAPHASTSSGASGGGGGGAIVIASSTKITITGSILAKGGIGGDNSFFGSSLCGGFASGGAIRLVAPLITGSGGTVNADGGCCAGSGFTTCNQPGGSGRIRIEAFSITGLNFNAQSPLASFSTAPGPVTAASAPALTNLPTLIIDTVGGVAAPATPAGSFTTADFALPTGTTNPVTVRLIANNIPLGTVFTVKLIRQFGSATSVNSSPSSGTFTAATATADVTFPSGQVSVLNVFANFTLPQTAALFPLIDGEPLDQVLVGANYQEPSTVTLRTRSGKEMRADQLPPEDQVKLAQAWQSMLRNP